jgi:hypothetical protein
VDEIMISKKWVVAVRVVIGLGAGLLWGVPKVLGRDQAEISASPTQQPAQETQTVWDDGSHSFVIQPGKYTVYVGNSSQHTPLTAVVEI